MKQSDITEQLDQLGFDIESICEAIVTTRNSSGFTNVAPMGVYRIDSLLEIKPFKTSTTCKYLLEYPQACVNITNDPCIFLITAFKEESFQGFNPVSVDDRLRLSSCDAHIFIDVIKNEDLNNRVSFLCQVSSIEEKKTTPKVFNRGKSEAIEAIIHATRIFVFLKKKNWEQVEILIKRFYDCKDVVQRVSAQNSIENKIIQALEKMIDVWREEF